MNALDHFYERQQEPEKSCLLAMKEIILRCDPNISNVWKYGMPFFCYKGKMFCYLWVHKKYGKPYLGMVEGKYFEEPFLMQENRVRMKIFLLDPTVDLPLKKIVTLIEKALNLYKQGVLSTKS